MVAENSTPIFQYRIASNDPDRVTVETRVNGQMPRFIGKKGLKLLALISTKLAPEATKSNNVRYWNSFLERTDLALKNAILLSLEVSRQITLL